MKKVNANTEWKELVSIAKELGVKAHGVKREVVVEEVNKAIDNLAKPKKVEKTLADYGLNENQVITISGREYKGKSILAGRQVQITKASKAAGFVNGHLINPKNGALQKTEVAIPVEIIITGEVVQNEEEVVA